MSVTVLENLPYGSHERQILDLYIPEHPKTEAGLILYIHGGGWTSGDKSAHTKDVEFWSEKGYICANMNYRYVDAQLTVFDELDDVTWALEKVKSVCGEYGFSPKKLLLSGGSAGAHLCLMYAYTRAEAAPVLPVAVYCHCPPTYCYTEDFLLGGKGEFEDWKYSVLSCCAGVSISKDNFLHEDVQGKLHKISPSSYVTAKAVPTGIDHGVQDELVPYGQTLLFLDALSQKGIPNDLLTYPNSGHALDKDPQKDEEAKERMEGYLEKYLVGSIC